MIAEGPGKVGRSGRRDDGPGKASPASSAAWAQAVAVPGRQVNEGDVYSAGMGSCARQDGGVVLPTPPFLGDSQYGHELSVTYLRLNCTIVCMPYILTLKHTYVITL